MVIWSFGNATFTFKDDYHETLTGPVVSGRAIDTLFGGIFASPSINDSLPHYKYRRIEDSFNVVKQKRELANKGISSGGSSSMGIGTYIFKDNEGRPPMEYYIGLDNYLVPDNNSRFYMNNGSFNLLYPVWDSVSKHGKIGHWASKPILVRYSADDKRVYVPVSKTKYTVLKTTFSIFWIICMLTAVYVLIGLPAKIVINIAQGRAFIKQNYRWFKIMGITLFALTLVKILLPYLFWLFYKQMIPEEIRPAPIANEVVGSFLLFLASLSLFLIGKAFQRGYQLQQDQNLTI